MTNIGEIPNQRIFGRIAAIPGMKHIELVDNPLAKQSGVPFIANNLTNCQDHIFAHVFKHHGQVAVTVVQADGGSEGAKSETIGSLLTEMAAIKLSEVVKQYDEKPDEISFLMHEWLISALSKIIELFPHGSEYLYRLYNEEDHDENTWVESHPHMRSVYEFIQRNGLAAFNMLYFGPNWTLTLQRGDGGFEIDGQLYVAAQSYVPKYAVYQLFPAYKLRRGAERLISEGLTDVVIPKPGFDVMTFDRAERAVIFSDGLPTSWIPVLWDTLTDVTKWNTVSRNKLLVWLRSKWAEGLSNNEIRKMLKDDCSVGVFERRE